MLFFYAGNFVHRIFALLKTKLRSQWIENQPAVSQSCKSYVDDLIQEDNPDQKRSEETQDLVPPDSQDLSLDVSKDFKSYKGKEEEGTLYGNSFIYLINIYFFTCIPYLLLHEIFATC